jgi:hypothetical protein
VIPGIFAHLVLCSGYHVLPAATQATQTGRRCDVVDAVATSSPPFPATAPLRATPGLGVTLGMANSNSFGPFVAAD